MAKTLAQVLPKLRELCLAFPEAVETLTWGKPHFRVREKIFAGVDDDDGRPVIGFKLSLERQAQMLRDKRFTKAPYVGHRGCVSMDLSVVRDWEEVRALLAESYCAIAPKKLAAQLGPETRAEARAETRAEAPAAARAGKTPRAAQKTRRASARKSDLEAPPDPRCGA